MLVFGSDRDRSGEDLYLATLAASASAARKLYALVKQDILEGSASRNRKGTTAGDEFKLNERSGIVECWSDGEVD